MPILALPLRNADGVDILDGGDLSSPGVTALAIPLPLALCDADRDAEREDFLTEGDRPSPGVTG